MIRIAIVDDHRLFRICLRRMLEDIKGLQIVAEAESGEKAVEVARNLQPNVMLMDLSMPGIGGLEATKRICRMDANVRVLVLSAYTEEPFPTQALSAGAHGYITKGVSGQEVYKAIRKIMMGGRYMSADVAQQLALRVFENTTSCPFENLSGREMQITLMVVNCHKVLQISNDLHLSPKTVNSYRYRIFEKLNVKSDVELTLLAVRHGMIDPQVNGVSIAG